MCVAHGLEGGSLELVQMNFEEAILMCPIKEVRILWLIVVSHALISLRFAGMGVNSDSANLMQGCQPVRKWVPKYGNTDDGQISTEIVKIDISNWGGFKSFLGRIFSF